jgi:glycerate kinase
MEMAQAAGITLVSGNAKNPLRTTTFGVGEMIVDAIKCGCRRFIVGIGGSATNDAGAGMLQALGFGLLDGDGRQIPYGGGSLASVRRIVRDGVLPELEECTFRIACDVTNPLCGERGASAVYGPQKGATPEMVAVLDSALAHFAAVAGGDSGFPGVGAAGGLGFAFREFLGGELKSGVEIVLEETRFEDAVRDADVVVTGEGRLDSQTVMGKAPIGVARMAKRHGKKVLAFSGCATSDAVAVNRYGIDAFFPILREVVPLETALDKGNAAANLAATAEQVFRCFLLGVH